MARQFQVIVEYDQTEKAWVTFVPALDHLSTFGQSREEALASTREAILGYLEAAANGEATSFRLGRSCLSFGRPASPCKT